MAGLKTTLFYCPFAHQGLQDYFRRSLTVRDSQLLKYHTALKMSLPSVPQETHPQLLLGHESEVINVHHK